MYKNSISPEDAKLFEKMSSVYVSENEKVFFETLHNKEIFEQAPSNEILIMDSPETEYIYFLRHDFDSYIIGSYQPGKGDRAVECYSLSNVLSLDLANHCGGIIERHITFHEWLRERDYAGIMYNHEYSTED